MQLQGVLVSMVGNDMHVRGAVRQLRLDADEARGNVSTIEHPIDGISSEDIGNPLLIGKQNQGRLQKCGADHRRRVRLGHGDGTRCVRLEMLCFGRAGGRGSGGS